MGMIFKDVTDDQQGAMMETIYVGQTWQFRYMKMKYYIYTAFWTMIGIGTTATVDYILVKYTDHSAIIGWLLG